MAENIDNLEVSKFNDAQVHWWDHNGPMKVLHQINPLRLAYIQQFSDLQNKSVLDIGCGGGILSIAMAQQGAIVHGIDANPSAIAVAHNKAQELEITATFQEILLEDFAKSRKKQFDVVTCLELLEHVPQPELIIEQAKKLLKPDGLIILSTINRTPKAYLLAILGAEYVLGIIPRQTHDYQKFIKPSELENWLSQQQLKLIDITGMTYNPFTGSAALASNVDVNYLMAAKPYS